MKAYPNRSLLVTPEQLSSELSGGQEPLILDLRPPDAYTAGHIPGAIHLDLWGVSLIDTDPAPLNAFMWMIEHVLAIHGVTASTPIVVYDEHIGLAGSAHAQAQSHAARAVPSTIPTVALDNVGRHGFFFAGGR